MTGCRVSAVEHRDGGVVMASNPVVEASERKGVKCIYTITVEEVSKGCK